MSSATSPLLTPAEVQALRARSDHALGLPGRAYFAPEFYEAERRHLFASGWMGVGFASDLPEPGSVKPVTIAGWELLLVRSPEGPVKCFHNICRHRGMKVVDGPCSVRSLRCRYHAWTYGLDGRLLATPAIAGIRQNETPGIDKHALGLVPVRCEQWFDLLFVNLDGEALPLVDHLRPAISRMERSFDLTQVAPASGGRSGQFRYAANWKVVVEGSIEDYHLPFVHRAFSHSADYVVEDGGSVYAGFSARRSLDDALGRYQAVRDGQHLPVMPRMAESGDVESLVLFLFPNTVLSCGPFGIATSLIVPTGPESVQYFSKTHFVREAASERYTQLRESSAGFWRDVFGEDEPIWEQVQALCRQRDELGLGTRFSPHWERGIHLFQLYVLDKLAPELAGTTRNAQMEGSSR